MSIARCISVVGSLYALMRNRLGINVATSLESQELSCTVAPDRRLVVLGHEPIAGFARDHGTVADQAAMLALHTLDSTTLLAEPTFVAPGDSCLRADDPGWRWYCITNHGQALADWERRPLASTVTGLQSALDGKQAASANLTTLAAVASSAAGRALMAVATPTSAKLVQINANASVTLIDGGGGTSVTPADLPSLCLWLDAGVGVLDEDGADCASGAEIATWKDGSGRGNHVTAPAGHRPTFTAAGGGGRVAVTFGGEQYMVNAALSIASLMDCAVIGVLRVTTTADNVGIVVLGASGGGNDYDSTGRLVVEQGTAANYAPFGACTNSKTRILLGPRPCARSAYSVQVVGGRIVVSDRGNDYRDVRTSATEGWSESLGSATGVLLGARWLDGAVSGTYLTGEIQELLICGSALTSYELAGIMQYLSTKWLR